MVAAIRINPRIYGEPEPIRATDPEWAAARREVRRGTEPTEIRQIVADFRRVPVEHPDVERLVDRATAVQGVQEGRPEQEIADELKARYPGRDDAELTQYAAGVLTEAREYAGRAAEMEADLRPQFRLDTSRLAVQWVQSQPELDMGR